MLLEGAGLFGEDEVEVESACEVVEELGARVCEDFEVVEAVDHVG